MKKIEKIVIILITITSILTVILFFTSFLTKNKDENDSKIEKTTSKFNYNLYENKSELYKEEFENLITILKDEDIDEEEYSKSITKLFIIDFYTLKNKKSSLDIGGTEYVHKDLKDNFILNASDHLYKYLSISDLNLPLVKGVSITNVETIEYEYNKLKYNGYEISLEWNYEEDFGYESKATIIVIKDKEQMYIVEKKEL